MTEWGPWIEHTPGPCPVQPGNYIGVETLCRVRGVCYQEGLLTVHVATAENWCSDGSGPWARILRFRIRKPKGLTILEEALEQIAANPKEEVEA